MRRALKEHLLHLSAAAFCVALGSPALAAPKDELNALRSRIEALARRLAETEESKSEAADALRESERAISEANRKLHELAGEHRAASGRLAGLNEQSRQQDKALEAQQALLGKLLYQRYIGGQPAPLRLLLNREDPNRIARQLHYYGYVSRARADLVRELREGLARLKDLARQTEEKLAELAAIRAEQGEQQQRLEAEKRLRSVTLARISRELVRQRREMTTLQRDERRLARLVESLGKLVTRARPGPRLRNERLPDASGDGSPFQVLKGRLNLPVRGELGNRFGSPRSDGGLTWKGLFISAKPGEAVKAIAAGRVVFADWLRGFGNLLIVDHGGSYMSLYGNNEALYRRVGDAIRGGDTIATVGNSGGNPDSGLYFEMRYQGKPFDPLSWIDLK